MPALLKELKRFYKTEGRGHLPWRKTKDPYKILVSELMLQQTQVERVIPFYKNLLKQFPTATTLAKAPLSKVLKAWQGLGYNRRAKFLHEAAKQIVLLKKFPRTVEEIEKLPGVGHYTARAVMAFAYNKPEVFVETNIRTVFLYHLPYKGPTFVSLQRSVLCKMSDAELLPLVARALKESQMEPRDFYAALMDYGAHLKRQGIKLNSKSRHYTKQSKFEGSTRQLRGAILRELLRHRATLSTLVHRIPATKEDMARELTRLAAEGLIKLHGKLFAVAE